MEVEGTATLCISTPVGSWNFYSELTELKDDKGQPVFNVKKVGTACQECLGTERESQCMHQVDNRPSWKTTESRSKVVAMYGDRKTLLQREILGQIADDENMAFGVERLKLFFERAPFREPHETLSCVYMCLDPNGGAKADTGSDTAIVSIFNIYGSIVICGLDAKHTRNGLETRNLARDHVKALRSIECLRKVPIVLIPEANLGNEAQEVANALVRLPGVEVACEEQDIYGVFTKPGMPAKYVHEFEKVLEDDALFYHATVASEDYGAARKEFERQLRSFRKFYELPKSLRSTVRVEYSGKIDNEKKRSSRLKDDMVMALLMAVYWSRQLRANNIMTRNYLKRFMAYDDEPK